MRLTQHWCEPKPNLWLMTRAVKGGDRSVWYLPRKVMGPDLAHVGRVHATGEEPPGLKDRLFAHDLEQG